MLKIGEFSKLSRVSVRMLRHYDDIGLLHPAEIDRFTDYRYYSEAQLPTVCRITALKDMGFRLADICRMTASDWTNVLPPSRRRWRPRRRMWPGSCSCWTAHGSD